MGIQGIEKQGDRQQVGAAAGAEPTGDERMMYGGGSLAPICLGYAALSEKVCRCLLGEAQAGAATAVKQVGVLRRRQNGEEALDASGLGIMWCQPAAKPQRGEPDLECVRKARRGLLPSAARARVRRLRRGFGWLAR